MNPLTFVSSHLGDPEPLTPAHLMHACRITRLPHLEVDIDELTDPNYGDAGHLLYIKGLEYWQLCEEERCHEYITSLREYHKALGDNQQFVRKGDVVIVHNNTPCTTWKMAIVEDFIFGKDGLVRAAHIRTANGIASRPITKLYPMEVNEANKVTVEPKEKPKRQSSNDSDQCKSKDSCPQRGSARKANDRVKEWIQLHSAPLENVTADEL